MSLISDYTWTQLCAFSVQTYSTSITMAIYFHMEMWSVVCKLMSKPPAALVQPPPGWPTVCRAVPSTPLPSAILVSNSTNWNGPVKGKGRGRDLEVLSD